MLILGRETQCLVSIPSFHKEGNQCREIPERSSSPHKDFRHEYYLAELKIPMVMKKKKKKALKSPKICPDMH